MTLKETLSKKIILFGVWFLAVLFTTTSAYAANRTVNLVVGYKTVHFAGKSIRAIAVNNQIPAPTLHFKQGDHVTINVYNHLKVGTAIHWHGLIVPWRMDGVANVSQKPIPPGGVFHYQFTLHQSGTYWYHAHAGLQEQQGLYGGLIIDPPHQRLHYNKDIVIVLSDWSNTDPEKIYANLKKEGDFYSAKMPLQPSSVRFIHDYRTAKTPQARKQIFDSYKMMQKMRMSIYDISDVAYDTFLLNGHPPVSPWSTRVKVGDIVRLRFIDAGGSTIFRVKIPGSTMQMVHVQGNDVQPYDVKFFTIAPGETYDVLIKINKNQPYIIYAESSDTSGAAYGALLTQAHQTVNYKAIKPFPSPKPVSMMGHSMNHSPTSHHSTPSQTVAKAPHRMTATPASMNMKAAPSISSKTKYDKMKAVVKTNNPNLPVHTMHMNLTGFMDHYIWFLNGVPEYKAKPVMIKHGLRYRIIFTNNTMMHHPMHIHGHWFILRNGHGAYDPLLHTIDVPPGATVVADFDANTKGQWFFHCHNLYHMKAGMANIFRYENTSKSLKGQAESVQHPYKKIKAKQPAIPYLSGHKAAGFFHATELDLSGDFFHNIYKGTLDSLIGPNYNKLQLYSEDAEIKNGKIENADLDVFYWRVISEFWAVKGGINYVYRPAATPYFQPGIGIEGLMPYFIQMDVRLYYHDGSAKLDLQLARDTQITNNFFIRLAWRSIIASKTISEDEIGSGLNDVEYKIRPYYRLTPNFSLYAEYEHTDYYGALKRIFRKNNESTHENVVSLGFMLLC